MDTSTLVSGLAFGEGPRWHEGQLWLSDMHAHEVLMVSMSGEVTKVVDVANRPSGLGWLPNGDLLIVSMTDQKLLRWDGEHLDTYAKLNKFAAFQCNDMVVDSQGRAYVGNFGFDLDAGETPRPADLICVDTDGSTRVAAEQLLFPNGAVITQDDATLIIAESFGARLTAFEIDTQGVLSNRRIWAELPDGAVPDGICLDEQGGIWSASPSTNECLRQVEGGQVTHRIALDQAAYACMLGGEDADTLFILTAGSSNPQKCIAERSGRIEVCQAPYARAGLP
jgi:sugar lactone lactonase YvrE